MAPFAPLFDPLPSYADAAGSSLHQRGGTPHPEFESVEARRATHMPHARVLDGQSRSLTGTEPAVYLVHYCCSSHGRPRDRSSKLVMRVRFPSPALIRTTLLISFDFLFT